MVRYRQETALESDARPVKPLLIASERTLSDYSIALRHILVGLADESVPVGLICPAESDVESLVPLPIEVIKHPAYELPLLWLQNRRALLDKLAKFRPTVLHCLCESKSAFTRKLSRRIGVPYVLSVNSLQRRHERLSISASRCVKIIVPAKSVAENIAKRYPKFERRIEQINIGTFVEDEACCFDKESELANLVTCFFGQNAHAFERFLMAIKRLASDGYKFMVVIMSDGKAERRLRKMLTDPVFAEIVIIVPRLEPWRSVLTAGDIYIRPTASDSFEPLLIEAISVGDAVAACRGGADDLVVEGKTAAVFNEGDEASIYDILRNLMANREVARKLAKSAQEFLRKEHSVSAMVSSLVEVYRHAQIISPVIIENKNSDVT